MFTDRLRLNYKLLCVETGWTYTLERIICAHSDVKQDYGYKGIYTSVVVSEMVSWSVAGSGLVDILACLFFHSIGLNQHVIVL